MRRAIGLAVLLVAVSAPPALAHVSVNPSEVAAETYSGGEGDSGHDEESSAYGDDEGADGTDPATFVALLVAGIAMIAAVAALIFARRRAPA